METPQDSCKTFQRPLSLGAEEDQEQQHGGNAVVSQAGEEGAEKGLVLGGLAQGGLDQGEVAEGKHAQEEPAQSSPTQEATGVGEEGEKKEEETEERHDGDGAAGPEEDNVQQEGGQNLNVQQEGGQNLNVQEEGGQNLNVQQEDGQNLNDQQQPQQEAAIPENNQNQRAENRGAENRGANQPPYSRTRFTHSQLRDLERLFQETRFPSVRVRKDLARWMGVDEYDVQNWFKMRRALFRRSSRLMMFCELPPIPENNSP